LAAGWFVGGCFAAVWFIAGCLATVVVGLLSGRCFAAESDLALPPLRMLCRSGCLRFFPGGCLTAGWFVSECFAAVWFIGGCFAAVAAGRSSV
jgi:hypothetical protein